MKKLILLSLFLFTLLSNPNHTSQAQTAPPADLHLLWTLRLDEVGVENLQSVIFHEQSLGLLSRDSLLFLDPFSLTVKIEIPLQGNGAVSYKSDEAYLYIVKGDALQVIDWQTYESTWQQSFPDKIEAWKLGSDAIYVANQLQLTALTITDGLPQWEIDLSTTNITLPSEHCLPYLYVRQSDRFVSAVSMNDGQVVWTTQQPYAGRIKSSDTCAIYGRLKDTDVLVRLEPTTGQPLWGERYAPLTMGNQIVIGGEQIGVVSSTGVVGLDTATGDVLWIRETGSRDLQAINGILFLTDSAQGSSIALSPLSGEVVWQETGTLMDVLSPDRLLLVSKDPQQSLLKEVDLFTGEVVEQLIFSERSQVASFHSGHKVADGYLFATNRDSIVAFGWENPAGAVSYAQQLYNNGYKQSALETLENYELNHPSDYLMGDGLPLAQLILTDILTQLQNQLESEDPPQQSHLREMANHRLLNDMPDSIQAHGQYILALNELKRLDSKRILPSELPHYIVLQDKYAHTQWLAQLESHPQFQALSFLDGVPTYRLAIWLVPPVVPLLFYGSHLIFDLQPFASQRRTARWQLLTFFSALAGYIFLWQYGFGVPFNFMSNINSIDTKWLVVASSFSTVLVVAPWITNKIIKNDDKLLPVYGVHIVQAIVLLICATLLV